MELNWYIALLGFCFSAFREISEHAKESAFPKHWPKWWNTGTAWPNKHNWGDRLGLPKWVFKSALVWITDAEHFFQMCSFLSAISAVMIGGTWQEAVTFYLSAQLFGAMKPLTKLK